MQLFKRNTKGTHFTVDGLINRGAYIPNNIFIGKWLGFHLGGGGLKTWGGGVKMGFYGKKIG